jgi:hypothetical protein
LSQKLRQEVVHVLAAFADYSVVLHSRQQHQKSYQNVSQEQIVEGAPDPSQHAQTANRQDKILKRQKSNTTNTKQQEAHQFPVCGFELVVARPGQLQPGFVQNDVCAELFKLLFSACCPFFRFEERTGD